MTSLKGICRCCLSEGKFKSMESAPPYSQSYAEMLNDILGYPLYSTGEMRLICGTCSNKLFQAIAFRKQVQAAEKAFITCLQQQSSEIKEECDLDKADMIMIIPDQKIEIITDECLPPSIDHEDSSILLEKSETSLQEHSLILQKLLQKADDICNEISSVNCPAETKSTALAEINVTLSQKQQTFYCPKCGEHLPQGSYRRHVFVCNRTCQNCKISFKNTYTLRRHNVDVHREGFVCMICDFVFISDPRLLKHQRQIHMQEKNVKCAHCDYECFDKTGLARHLRVHYDNRPYECRICKKKFKKHTTRIFHERIHTGDKRKVCQICGEKFVQRASLKYHLEKHHPGDAC